MIKCNEPHKDTDELELHITIFLDNFNFMLQESTFI